MAAKRTTVVTIKETIPVDDSMVFEQCFDEQLQMSLADKIALLRYMQTAWLLVDGKLVGESYGAGVNTILDAECIRDDEPTPGLDTIPQPHLCFYMYSTAILPVHQGHGWGKLLKAYMLGLAKGSGYQWVVGHARVGASLKLNQYFGARTVAGFDNWYGTGHTYYMYKQAL